MKKIKSLNGFTIYETTKRDEKDGYTIGEYVLYFSSDIKDFGREYSDVEYTASTMEEAEELANGTMYAIAKEELEKEYTAVSHGDIEKRAEELEAEELHITKHTGKMEGMESISNSCYCNEFCKAMHESGECGGICAECFAFATEDRYHDLEKHLRNNSRLLAELIPFEKLPFINRAIFRFDSFGELLNVAHMCNYINIAKKNPTCIFSLWTKRKDIVKEAIEKEGKPANMILIYSSPVMNRAEKLPLYFDKVFTVYRSEYALSNNTAINCGDKKCINCRKCYNLQDMDLYINEMLKKDMKKFKKNGGAVL